MGGKGMAQLVGMQVVIQAPLQSVTFKALLHAGRGQSSAILAQKERFLFTVLDKQGAGLEPAAYGGEGRLADGQLASLVALAGDQ